jgi:PAS domain S-box-containing protein
MAPDGRFLYVSPSCKQITGHDAEEFIDDKTLIYQITHPEDRRKLVDHVHQVDSDLRGGEVEFRVVRPDGAERHIAHACAPVFDSEGEFLGHRGSNRDVTERKFAEDALRESEKTLRFLSSQLLTIQETERKRVARELHDGINQTLSAIKFSLETKLEGMDGDKAPDGISLERIVSLVQGGIEEARRIQMDLRPPMLDDLGIVATLRWFTREFHTVYKHIHVEMEADLNESDVSDTIKVALFRIVQEAMYNVSRHSRADSVRLSLKRVDDKIELMIEDNGIGFDMENSRKGVGITSMRERAELSLGTFLICSAPNQGTSIMARWVVRS